MPDQVLIVRDVPADKVEKKTKALKDAGAKKVDKILQTNGKFTLRAMFPD